MRKKQRQVRAFSILASIVMIFSLITPGLTFAESNGKVNHSLNDSKINVQNKVSSSLQSQLENEDKVTFLIKFTETADVMGVAHEARESAQNANLSALSQEHAQRSAVISELKSIARESQQKTKLFLEEQEDMGNAEDIRSYHIVNGMAVTATKEVAEKLASFSEVEKLLPNEQRELIRAVDTEAEVPENETAEIEWNVDRIGAPAVWDMGIDGQGTVVASIDTGADWEHPALQDKYRGYDPATGEVDHTYSFYDPVNGEEVPYDDDSHGTHVTGTMVGSEADGSNQVGVAPGAQWISVQAFTPAGAYDTDLLAAAQWILAPGGDATKAPDVVNNSWGGGPGLDEWYRDAVTAWRAAEIFPAFAAGNTTLTNPGGPGSVAVPANYPESFATGSTNSSDDKSTFSLEGPSPYDEIKPDIAAPGEGVRSSIPGGGYGGKNGTSMASPAIAGVVALLKSANANLDVDTTEEILMEMADSEAGTDESFPESPNNGYGYGIVDAYAAVSSVISGLGTIEGQVTMHGEDTEPPTYEHESPAEIYEGMDLDLTIEASDNVSVTSVEFHYNDEVVELPRASGDHRSGEYNVTVPGEEIVGDEFTYHFVINDYGGNEVTTDIYEVNIEQGITVGYFQDFETAPNGWISYGENNSWEWGIPTYGPDAYSGERVYATNLDGDHGANNDMMLEMPPIDLPEGNSYLQFKHWYHTHATWDMGYVLISTDQENWEQLAIVEGESDGWEDFELRLGDYAGQRVHIAFHFTSTAVVHNEGWYLDDVGLSDEPLYEDTEPPTYQHEVPAVAYDEMNLPVGIDVQDNFSVELVELQYQDSEGSEWQSVDAELIDGDELDGSYSATLPGDIVSEPSIDYRWRIVDYGGNEVVSDIYEVQVDTGITLGYSENFETNPGWISEYRSSWEVGTPTSGPEGAIAGENVYATILDGDYPGNSSDQLIMPPVELPEGNAYLQFKHWYMFEQGSGDFGEVQVSTDQENWETLAHFSGQGSIWQHIEADLSDYAGEEIYLAFYFESDGSVHEPGWYLDDVELTDTSIFSTTHLSQQNGFEKMKAEDTLETQSNTKEKQSNDNKRALQTDAKNHSVPEKDNPQTENSKTENESNEANVSGLPLAASVSVIESGRSVNTNPEDGTYSFVNAAGDFTVAAESYGFHPNEQSVTIEEDSTTEVNFTLEEMDQYTVSGTVTNENSGDPIEGAAVLLVEDANVDPVETDVNGDYEITGYEGDYTLRVIASDFYSKDVEITIDGNVPLDIELEPFYTVPGGEIYYDDGTAENARAFYDAGNKWAVKMSLPEDRDSALVTDGVFQFHDTDFPTPGDTPFAVEVWSAGEDGMPDERLAGPVEDEAIRDLDEWTVVDLRDESIQVDGDFFMVYVQTQDNTNSPGLATDEDSPNAERSYQEVGGVWSPSPAAEGNYMIRARVAYEVETPVITSPDEGLITNEADVTVEGTASPETTVEVLQNGEEAGSVEIGEDGSFALDTELAEGENEFTALTYVNGEQADESDPVTVTLDTEAPDLTITSPEDGEKADREIAVEGTVSDEHLDAVTVNGEETEVTDGAFSHQILLYEGENVIEIVATDLAGNTTTETITVYVDDTPPEIFNLKPDEDKELETGQSVMIEFESEPGLQAKFIVHMPLTDPIMQTETALELPMMEISEGKYVGYWTVPRSAYANGAAIEVIATDSFGNEARKRAEGRLFINLED
ncbi:S8 family serine peptidase [Virgibacillus oceani]